MTDDLEPLLTPTTPESARRDELLRQTTAVLRRRRRLRRLAWAGAMAACYAAGALTTYLALRPRPTETPVVAGPVDPPAPEPESPKPPPWERQPKPDPRAVAEAERRLWAEHYRAEGRRRERDGDWEAALAYYRRWLDAGGDRTDVDADDSWLVIALKRARQEESEHVRKID